MNEITPQECAERLKRLSSAADITFTTTGTLKYAAAVMRKFAAGELVEVVHAQRKFSFEKGCEVCSHCGNSALWDNEDGQVLSPHCPSCGALMMEGITMPFVVPPQPPIHHEKPKHMSFKHKHSLEHRRKIRAKKYELRG